MRALRGVNLGGWLVLERWIAPSVFKGTMATDEYGLCRELGEKRYDRLDQHRATFITEDDFIWIKDKGMDAVRLPVPHWLFGGYDFEPYVECLKYVDLAFEWAWKHDLNIVLDLHTAPGSQNGHDHSGQKGGVGWPKDPAQIKQTLQVVGNLAERYGRHPVLAGFELLNEPSGKIPKTTLTNYYQQAADAIREYSAAPLIISDAFQSDVWAGEHTDMWLDMHLYQVFSAEDKKRPIHKVIKKAKYEWSDQLAAVQKKRPVIVGEWSLALDKKALRGLDEYERDMAMKAYGYAQLAAFEQASGWFYWTYKTEDGGAWSFRDTIQRGWLYLD